MNKVEEEQIDCRREECHRTFTDADLERQYGSHASVNTGGFCSARCFTKHMMERKEEQPSPESLRSSKEKWDNLKKVNVDGLIEQIEVIDQGIPTGTGEEEPVWYSEMMAFYDELQKLKTL
jgi:hypothetical protein